MIIELTSSQKREIIDFTDQIEIPKGDGLVNLFVRHTTACIGIGDMDPGTDKDYLSALSTLTPQANWNHPHDPSHFPDHLWPAIIGSSINIPYQKGALLLGTWQRIMLIELDGPREREVVITSISSR